VRGALAGLKKGSRACGRASWPRNPVTCASAHALVHGEREEGGTNKAGPRRRERNGTRGSNSSSLANRARETERERANGRRKLAPTGRPHWAVSERGRAHARENCR
jgi:hypothetical protein